MNRISAPVLLLACSLFFTGCNRESARDQGLADKIKQLETIRDRPLVHREEKEKEMQQFARELTRAYSGAHPIRKDSAERIIRSPLPDTIGFFQKIDRYTLYQKPAEKVPFDSAITYPREEYFLGMANYGVRKGKRLASQQGIITIVKDMGYAAEWFSLLMANQVVAGKGQAGFDLLMKSHRYEKTIEHLGQRWAVWYEPTYTSPRYHAGSRVFITYWNHRFAVFGVTTDTTQHAPGFVAKVLDVAWLDQLKYTH